MLCLFVMVDLVWRGPLRLLQYGQALLLPLMPRPPHVNLLDIGLLLLPVNEHVSLHGGEAIAARHMRCLRVIMVDEGLLAS